MNELATTNTRKQALEIIESGITAVLPQNIMRSKINYNQGSKVLTVNNDNYDLSKGRLFIIGGGKAAGLMAETLETIIPPEDITEGLLNCNSSDYNTKKIKIHKAEHPIPGQNGVKGVKQMLRLKEEYSINNQDLIICLLSGGGSALMPYPVDEVTLEEKQLITDLLLASGASIQEINIIRKHLSKIKGGRLGEFFQPTKVVSIIISDVIGNDISSIASGPTYPDSSTFQDAHNVLKKFDILSKTPENVINFIKDNMGKDENETPTSIENCMNYIIGDIEIALDEMKNKAEDLRLKPKIITSKQIGEPGNVALQRAQEILSGKYQGYNTLILGGETTPKLPKHPGIGGRNQHYTAASMLTMKDYPKNWLVVSVATDGADFVPGIAGAIVDNTSLSTIEENGYDIQKYLDEFDSYSLLKKLKDSLIITGNTGTNVGDIILYILE